MFRKGLCRPILNTTLLTKINNLQYVQVPLGEEVKNQRVMSLGM